MLQDEGWEEGEEEDGEGGDVEEGPSLSVCRVTGGGRSRLTGGQRSGTAITFLPRYISTRSKAERSSNRNVLHAADRIPGSVCHQHRASSGADLQYTILFAKVAFIYSPPPPLSSPVQSASSVSLLRPCEAGESRDEYYNKLCSPTGDGESLSVNITNKGCYDNCTFQMFEQGIVICFFSPQVCGNFK